MKKFLLGAAVALMGAGSMSAQVVDPATYAESEGYSLTNLWLRCVQTENCPAFMAGGGNSRSAVALGDKLYVCNRSHAVPGVQVYDLETGEDLGFVGADIETAPNSNLGYVSNYIDKDDAGHLVIFNMQPQCDDAYDTRHFTATYINPDNILGKRTVNVGTAEEPNNYEYNYCESKDLLYFNAPSCSAEGTVRIDTGCVSGDIMGNATLYAPVTSQPWFFRWTMTDGAVDDWGDDSDARTIIEEYYPSATASNGYGPCIESLPYLDGASQDLFWLDGNGNYPTLYDNDAMKIDSFEFNTDGSLIAGETSTVANNGCEEITLNDNTFFLYSFEGGATATTPCNFLIVKEDGAASVFENAKIMWKVPANSMGYGYQGNRIARPNCVIKEDASGNEYALVALHNCSAGIGVYKMALAGTAVNDVNADKANVQVIAKAGAVEVIGAEGEIEVCNLQGQTIAKTTESTIALPAGVVIVKANGEAVKAIVK